jgi:hypothetical protein
LFLFLFSFTFDKVKALPYRKAIFKLKIKIMKNAKKLTKEEMKGIEGGVNKTIWQCYFPAGVYIGNICANTDPSTTCISITSCTNTLQQCTMGTFCI